MGNSLLSTLFPEPNCSVILRTISRMDTTDNSRESSLDPVLSSWSCPVWEISTGDDVGDGDADAELLLALARIERSLTTSFSVSIVSVRDVKSIVRYVESGKLQRT